MCVSLRRAYNRSVAVPNKVCSYRRSGASGVLERLGLQRSPLRDVCSEWLRASCGSLSSPPLRFRSPGCSSLLLAQNIKKIFFVPRASNVVRGHPDVQSHPYEGVDASIPDSHDGPEGGVRERIVPVAKTYTRERWDEFVHALDALPEKPRNQQRVSVSDAMKEIRAHIAATQVKGYTLEEIVQEAGRKGLDVSIGAVKYALYRPARLDTASEATGPQERHAGNSSSGRKKTAKRMGNAHGDAGQQRGRGVNQPGPMQGQDTFAFEIRPDIENL